jgi:hypothetical protein
VRFICLSFRRILGSDGRTRVLRRADARVNDSLFISA